MPQPFFPLLRVGLLVLGGLLALSTAAQRPSAPPRTRHPVTTLLGPERVPMEVLPSGHLVVQATVNGVKGRFLLDTGAGLTLLTQAFAQHVQGLQPQDGRFTGFRATGDRLDFPLYTARTLAVGRLVTTGLSLGIYVGELGGFDGLLSLTVFRHQPVTLDYGQHALVLETAASLGQRRQAGRAVALRLNEVYGQALDMAAYFRVNEKLTLLLVLDSGTPAGQYRLNAAFAPRLGIDTAGLGPARRTSIPSEFSATHRNFLYRATLTKLTPAAQPSIQLTQVPVGLMTGLIYDGILPLNWLGDQLTIDLPQQVLLVH